MPFLFAVEVHRVEQLENFQLFQIRLELKLYLHSFFHIRLELQNSQKLGNRVKLLIGQKFNKYKAQFIWDQRSFL